MELMSNSSTIIIPFPSTPVAVVSLLAIAIFIRLSLLVFLKTVTISKTAKSYSHFPGPKALPLIGNLHLLLGAAAAPHQMFRDLAAKYGPLFHLQLGETHFLVISSADLAKQVMKTHDVNFANRPPGLVPAALGYNYSDVVFAPYGEYWRQLKKTCTLELLSVRRVQSFRPIREEENMNMARWLASCQGSPADLSERLHLSSYDVVTRVVVGAKTAQRAAMTRILEEATKTASGFILADLYPSIRWLPFITGASFKIGRVRRELDRVFDSIIQQHRDRANYKANSNSNMDRSSSEDLVDVLLKIQADETQEMSLSDDNIKAVLADLFTAGTDTSTTVVEWAMSEMIREPSKLHKAQEEVRRVFDDKGYVEEDKFDELKYLKLVIKETLRLHPPAPLLIPKVNAERCEIDGYEIPAKSRVAVNAWALGRSGEYWEEAERFEPERFDSEGSAIAIDFKGNNLEFIPFGAGRRMCPGMAFGLANVHFPLATLLYHFDWEMPFGIKNQDLDMTEKFGATVNRKHHLLLIPILNRPLPSP